MKIFLITALFFCYSIFLYAQNGFDISSGQFRLAESYIPISLGDFSLVYKGEPLKIESKFVPKSVQWIRSSDNILLPRARVSIDIFSESKSLHVRYRGISYIPEKHQDSYYIELFSSLFQHDPIEIIIDGKLMGQLAVVGFTNSTHYNRHLIDLSCQKWGLETEQLQEEYISIGCKMYKNGTFGNETPSLEVTLFSTNLELLDHTKPPFKTILTSKEPVIISVLDKNGARKEVTIRATKLPTRLNRLHMAWGIGPYPFKSQFGNEVITSKLAPSFMLYARLDIDDKTSFRLFDALVFHRSIFNNFGMYYAYELAEIWDGDIQIVPLIGFQSLTFMYDREHALRHDIILPQGGEIMWRNPLGLNGYLFFYGIFKDLGISEYNYLNTWIRFGKRTFYELNYISWEHDRIKSSMWGLSVGFPLGNFF